ncbi:MAG TPA: DUF308 domain-containing protein [Nitrososphaeraceae archaeon]|nr:DUF308 domain-containing protein [Nitrososphaeraceae archaeon]
MAAITSSDKKLSKGIRILQVIIGIIAISLSIAEILNPGFGLDLLIFLLSITIFAIGIERISMGFMPNMTKSSRITNIILGALAIVLAIIVIAFPVFTIGFLVRLLSIGLLFIGFSRIVHGVLDKRLPKWPRAFLIGVGILSIVVSLMVLTNPFLGLFLLILILAVNFLIIGIESIVEGVSCNRNLFTPSSSSSSFTSTTSDTYDR